MISFPIQTFGTEPFLYSSHYFFREKNLPVGKHFSFTYITNFWRHYKMGLTEEQRFRRAFDYLMWVRTTAMYWIQYWRLSTLYCTFTNMYVCFCNNPLCLALLDNCGQCCKSDSIRQYWTFASMWWIILIYHIIFTHLLILFSGLLGNFGRNLKFKKHLYFPVREGLMKSCYGSVFWACPVLTTCLHLVLTWSVSGYTLWIMTSDLQAIKFLQY